MSEVDYFHPHIQWKTPEIKRRAGFLSAQCVEIMNDQAAWCLDRGLPYLVTETVTTLNEDRNLKRTSRTHREGRAWDVSVRGWLELAITEFMKLFSDRFRHVAAIGAKTGQPELIVRHDNGNGDHLHVQIGKVFGVKDPMAKMKTV